MEESFEIVLRQKEQEPVGVQQPRAPKEIRRAERSKEQRPEEIPQQSGCVFQDSNVGFPADAESTHMEGKGRGGPQA